MNVSKKTKSKCKENVEKNITGLQIKGRRERFWWKFLLLPAQVKTGPGLELVNNITAGIPAVTRLSTAITLFQKSIGMN